MPAVTAGGGRGGSGDGRLARARARRRRRDLGRSHLRAGPRSRESARDARDARSVGRSPLHFAPARRLLRGAPCVSPASPSASWSWRCSGAPPSAVRRPQPRPPPPPRRPRRRRRRAPKPPRGEERSPPAVPKPGEVLGDPRQGEVSLPAGDGWRGALVLDNAGVGVWIVGSFQVFDRLGCPEVIGLDDRGRMYVLTSYSGRWTPLETVHDGAWLGGLATATATRDAGAGALHRLPARQPLPGDRAHRRRRAREPPDRADRGPGDQHADPRRPRSRPPGKELLLFTWPGGLYRATPRVRTGPSRSNSSPTSQGASATS